MIINQVFPERAKVFVRMLLKYTQYRNIKKQKDYIAKGQWKKRAGGLGLEDKLLGLKTQECFKESWVYFYTLDKEIDDFFLELFKPFGEIRLIGTNGHFPVYLLFHLILAHCF